MDQGGTLNFPQFAIITSTQVKVRSHLQLFAKFSWAKSNYFNRNAGDLEIGFKLVKVIYP